MSLFTFAHGAEQSPIGLYIHVPFCARKCPYCDFNTYAGLGSLHARTVQALCSQLETWGSRLSGRPVASVFVGGGTPTILAPASLTELIETVKRQFALAERCEITVEANPGTVDRAKFQLLHDLGVNRLSMGVQSFQPQELQFLGRIHDTHDAYTAFEAARAAGFDNISLDFIFGLPNQKREDFENTLAQAMALQPEHLSLYSLIVEPDTPLFQWVETGVVSEPDDDLAAELYEVAMERLGAGGYLHYEVSNWARADSVDSVEGVELPHVPRRACRHNLLYWRNDEYIGVGPGAHSHLRLRDDAGMPVSHRWSDVKAVAEYARRVEGAEPVSYGREEVDARSSMGETMMLGLRLIQEGVSYRRFEELHGLPMEAVFGRELRTLQQQGLLRSADDRVLLTPRGLMIGNQVFATFLPDTADVVVA